MPRKIRYISFDPHILTKIFSPIEDVSTERPIELKTRHEKLLYVLKREVLSLPIEQRKIIYEVFFRHKRITEVVQEMSRTKKCNKNTVYNNYYKATISLCKRLSKLNLIEYTDNKIMVNALKMITTDKFYG